MNFNFRFLIAFLLHSLSITTLQEQQQKIKGK